MLVVEVEKQRGAEVLVETAGKAGAACKPKEIPLVVAELRELTCTARGRRTTAAEPDFAHFAEFETAPASAPAPARRTAAATAAEADRDSIVSPPIASYSSYVASELFTAMSVADQSIDRTTIAEATKQPKQREPHVFCGCAAGQKSGEIFP